MKREKNFNKLCLLVLLIILILGKAFALDPEAQSAYNRARAAWEILDGPAAINEIMEVIRLAPDFADAYVFRANILIYMFRRGDFDMNAANYGAIPDLTQAIRLDPNNVRAYLLRGEVYVFIANDYYGRGDRNNANSNFDLAIRDLSQVIRLDPDNEDAYMLRGASYLAKGDRNVINDLENVLRINPNNTDARQYLNNLRAAGW